MFPELQREKGSMHQSKPWIGKSETEEVSEKEKFLMNEDFSLYAFQFWQKQSLSDSSCAMWESQGM